MEDGSRTAENMDEETSRLRDRGGVAASVGLLERVPGVPCLVGDVQQSDWAAAGYDSGGRQCRSSTASGGLDGVPLSALSLPSRGRGQVAAADAVRAPDERDGNTTLAEAEVGVVRAGGLPYVTAPSDTYVQFFQGYFDAEGGQDEARIDAMIGCESSWQIDPPGDHLGLAQFDWGTWATVSGITGLADPYNPYHQGYNVAVWASMISSWTNAGWPNCFHAID